MNFELYCVKDSVTGQFGKPELYYNKAHAVRHMNDTYGKSPIAKDIALYYLGQFDCSRGVVTVSGDNIIPASDGNFAFGMQFVCFCEVIIDEK